MTDTHVHPLHLYSLADVFFSSLSSSADGLKSDFVEVGEAQGRSSMECNGCNESSADVSRKHRTALIVLNYSSSPSLRIKKALMTLWNVGERYRVVADGGCKLLWSIFKGDEQETYIPHVIAGDMDSATPEILRWYESRGVTITRIEDDDTTDLQKCLDIVYRKQQEASEAWNVLVFNCFAGRLDHQMQNLNALYCYSDKFHQLTLISEAGYACLLKTGINRLTLFPPVEGQSIGLLPLGGPACLTTSGLMWDVSHWHTSFGGPMSTSNRLRCYSDATATASVREPVTVTVETTAPIVWSSTYDIDLLVP